MMLQLIAFIALFVLAATTAVWARMERRRPSEIINRIRGVPAEAAGGRALFLTPPGAGALSRFAAWLGSLVPPALVTHKQQERLVQAGFTSRSAPAIYLAAQTVLAGVMALTFAGFLADQSSLMLAAGTAVGLAVGMTAPPAFVARVRERRQQRIRHGLPDMLDLLLICVEAGISLDAAILRVGRELAFIHPEISEELLTLGRKQNAGIPREEALRGMYPRTGLTELRSITANIIQSERWGTSIARVLRIDSEVMRRKRREAAERRAALASTKMIFPLALLILPALLIVIGGPVLIQIRDIFNALSQGK